MKVKGTRTIKLADIRINTYVRWKLDDDRVLELAELINNGIQMRDPLEVTERNGGIDIVDGRTRKAAYELCGVTDVKVKVLEFDNEAELIAYAYNVNKGPKPPTRGDTEHTISELGKLNVGIKRIAEMLELPAKIVQGYLNDIRAKDKRTKLRQGEDLVREQNLKVTEAADQVGVKPEELKGFLGGHRKRRTDVAEIQQELTRFQKSSSQRVARLLDKVFKQFEVGDLSKKQVERILDKVESLNKQWGRTITDRKARFAHKANGEESEAVRDSA